MLPESLLAAYLLVCLGFFFAVNLDNIRSGKRWRRPGDRTSTKVERPIFIPAVLAMLGTVTYFVEVVLYSLAALTGSTSTLNIPALSLDFMLELNVQILGLAFTGAGCLLFIWSVVARGKYAVSWDMPEDQRLVTWGPYQWIRHPSYLGYFLMFFGFVLLWPNLLALPPLLAIPGYIRVTFDEEKLLIHHFGEKYLEYQRKTGRFIPRLLRVGGGRGLQPISFNRQ